MSLNLLGKELKEFLGVKWIADFRDEWVGYPGTTEKQNIYLEKLEKKVAESADLCTFAHEKVREDFSIRTGIATKRTIRLCYTFYF